MRKNQFHEDDTISAALNFDKEDGLQPKTDQIEAIFDDIIAEENPSLVAIITRVPNLLMVTVIGLCIVL